MFRQQIRCGSRANAAFSWRFRTHAVSLHIPMWRLSDPTAMAAPSLYASLQTVRRKICLLLRLQRLCGESRSALAAVKFRCFDRGPGAMSSSENDDLKVQSATILNFFFLFLPHRFQARCLCRYAR